MALKKRKVNLTDDEKLQIIQDYMTTNLSNRELADKYQTSENNVELIVSRHWKTLTNIRETKNLVGDQFNQLNHKGGNYMALKAISKVPSINQKFLDLLSDPNDPDLTDNELQYCFHYVATGDNYQAIHVSGLHIALMGGKGDKDRNQYELACTLRGHYLRRKRNIADCILKLKSENYLPDIVDKKFVQRELLEQLNQLKESGDSASNRTQTLKTIELLGKSVGAFSEVLKIQEVDPAKALDYIDSLSLADAKLISSEETYDSGEDNSGQYLTEDTEVDERGYASEASGSCSYQDETELPQEEEEE